MRERRLATLLLVVAALAGTGCRGWTSSRPPIHVNPNMDHQPKYRPQAESRFFYDGAAMRVPVEGTVARGELWDDTAFYEGDDAEGNDIATSPVEPTDAVLARGAERFRIYCQPCHDARGEGKGILFERGLPTTSLFEDRLRTVEDGYLFEVISDGRGLMPGYRWPIPAADRWAIIAHVRELQRRRPVEDGGAGE
jgi:mono/diheme cytochrome c family protein